MTGPLTHHFLISFTFRSFLSGEIRETQLQHVRAVLEQQVIKADTEAAAKITDAEGKLRDAKTKADQVTIEVMNKARISRCVLFVCVVLYQTYIFWSVFLILFFFVLSTNQTYILLYI